MGKPKKSNRAQSSASDLFASPVTPQPMMEPIAKVVLTMPSRGPTYSEEWRKACELRALHEYQQKLNKAAWAALWLDIAKQRGEQAAQLLAHDYRGYLQTLKAG